MSKPNLPSIPPSRSGDQTVDRIKELVEIWKGERGNPLDQAVTYRELVKAGLGKVSRAGVLSSAVVIDNDTGGVVGDSQTVSPLSNLSAVGGFRLVILDWEGTQQAAYAYTEVWRATEDNLANAVLIGTSIASLYSDTNVISGQEYFYWVRAVSVTNNKSAFNATAGESAMPVLEPDYIIGLIEGLIGASELAAEVLTPIQAIPSIQTTLSELGIEVPALDGRLTTAEGTLLTQSGQITALQSSLNDLTVNPFNANETYDLNDLFSYSGTTYRVIATQTPPNSTPPNATYYEEATDVESLADTVAANTGAINALDARVVATEGGISSQASQIVQLTADLSNTNNNVSGNTSAISALDSRTTSTETGLASVGSNVLQLQAELDAAELAIQGNSDATSALESRVEVNEDTVSAHSSDITLLQNGLTDAQGEAQANSTALGLLDAQVQTHDGEITAQGASIAQIENTVDDPVTGVVATSNGLNALSGRVDVTENEISAISSDVQTLEAEVDGNRAAVQTKAEASVVQDLEDQVIVLQAKWVLQVDVNGHVAGIALANDGEQSELVVASSAVYFIDPDQSSVEFNPNTNYASIAALRQTQFIFGYALVEGQRRFVINVPAYIPDGTITSAQISNAVISMAQIADLKVSAAEIDDAAITSAKLASVIQSDNFLPGQRGWRILRSGAMELNDGLTVNANAIIDTLQLAGSAVTLPLVSQLAVDVTIPDQSSYSPVMSVDIPSNIVSLDRAIQMVANIVAKIQWPSFGGINRYGDWITIHWRIVAKDLLSNTLSDQVLYEGAYGRAKTQWASLFDVSYRENVTTDYFKPVGTYDPWANSGDPYGAESEGSSETTNGGITAPDSAYRTKLEKDRTAFFFFTLPAGYSRIELQIRQEGTGNAAGKSILITSESIFILQGSRDIA